MAQSATAIRETIPRPRKYYTEPNFLDILGTSIAYRRKGTGEPVLFLHGAGMTRMWLPFYEEMSKQVDFIAPEHPGFGESPMPAWFKGIGDDIVLYDEMLRRLKIDRFHLVGLSLGGWIAAELATTYARAIKSLTLIAPIGLRMDWAPLPDIFQIAPETLLGKLLADPKKIEEFAPAPHDLDEMMHLYGEGGAFARRAWTPRYDTQLDYRLARVTAPGLVVQAEKDLLVPEAIGTRYAKLLPNATTVRIAGSGHVVPADKPVETAQAILSHIKKASQS